MCTYTASIIQLDQDSQAWWERYITLCGSIDPHARMRAHVVAAMQPSMDNHLSLAMYRSDCKGEQPFVELNVGAEFEAVKNNLDKCLRAAELMEYFQNMDFYDTAVRDRKSVV